jgi:hypothetical protein
MQEINAIVLSDKLPPNVTSFFTKILNDICEDEAQGIVVAYVAKNGDIMSAYLRCTVNDMRRCAEAINDEAMLRIIALNQERIDRMREEMEDD